MKNCKILAIIFIGILMVSSPALCDWQKVGFNYYGEAHNPYMKIFTDKKIYCYQSRYSISLYNLNNGELLKRISSNYIINDYSISDDMRFIAIGSQDLLFFDTSHANIHIIDLDTKQIIDSINDPNIEFPPYIDDLQFSPSGKYLLYSKDYTEVKLYNLSNSKTNILLNNRTTSYRINPKYIKTFNFSNDDKYLTFFNRDTSRIWNLDGKKEINSFKKGIYFGFTQDSKNILI